MWLDIEGLRTLQNKIYILKNWIDTLFFSKGMGGAVKLFLIIIACRLPLLLWLYPGVLVPDTASSIEQFYGYRDFSVAISTNDMTVHLTNHHPFLYTIMYGLTFRLGDLIGNQGLAVFLFLLLQTVAVTALLVMCLRYFRKRGYRGSVFLAFFYALYPLYGVWSAMMIKDEFFSFTLLWLSLLLMQMAETKGRVARSIKFRVIFGICAMVFMLSKNQCFYILVLFLPVVFFYFKRYRWQTVRPLLVALIFYKIVWMGILLPCLRVVPSGNQEMWGFMFQQTALCVKEHGPEIRPEERRAIAAILPYDKLDKLYNPLLQDPVKYTYNLNASGEDYKNYALTQWNLFKRYPLTCVQALWNECYGYFYPSSQFPLAETTLNVESPSPGFYTLKSLVQHPRPGFASVLKIPGLSLIFDMGFFIPLFILCWLYAASRRNYKAAFVSLPIIISIGILVMSPQNGCFRYVMPIFWSGPLLGLYCLQRTKRNA